MVDFSIETRKRCRNPKCKLKLPAPVSNDRDAFCCRGCFNAFYHLRCLVCEEAMQRKTSNQKDCGRRKCRNAMQSKSVICRFLTTDTRRPDSGSDSALKSMAPERIKSELGWHIVAGPALTPSQMHCATIPDGEIVDGKPTWDEGSYNRMEAQNRRALKAHFAEKAKDCLIQPNHMPLNIQGGYQPKRRALKLGPEKSLDEIRDRVAAGIPFNDPDAEQWKLPDPVIPGLGYDRAGAVSTKDAPAGVQHATIPDDLSIPPFLDRRPRPALKAAA
jgi:hypothetical protein